MSQLKKQTRKFIHWLVRRATLLELQVHAGNVVHHARPHLSLLIFGIAHIRIGRIVRALNLMLATEILLPHQLHEMHCSLKLCFYTICVPMPKLYTV
jgi:hypothetical protein